MKMNYFSIINLFALVLFATFTHTALAETSAWTGCVTPGGAIIHLANGNEPKEHCQGKQALIHLRDVAAYQNTQANYDHAKICEALHALGLDSTELDNLGCPSTPTLTRQGIVKAILPVDYRTNESLGNVSVCDIFDVIPNGDLNTLGGFQWTVKGGFVASEPALPFVGGKVQCGSICEADDKCIAAWYNVIGAERSKAGTCRIFHYSDRVDDDWGHYCGVFKDGNSSVVGSCVPQLSSSETRWFVRVPDGQTVGNCPGLPPVSP